MTSASIRKSKSPPTPVCYSNHNPLQRRCSKRKASTRTRLSSGSPCASRDRRRRIFAGIQTVPFVPLPYASKVSGFWSDLEMPMPPIAALNVGKLCAFLDRSWDLRNRIKKQLEERVPPLQERAKQTNRILCDLLRSLKPE